MRYVGFRLDDAASDQHFERGVDHARPIGVGTDCLGGPPFAAEADGNDRGCRSDDDAADAHRSSSAAMMSTAAPSGVEGRVWVSRNSERVRGFNRPSYCRARPPAAAAAATLAL